MVAALLLAMILIWLDENINELIVRPPIQIRFTVVIITINLVPIFIITSTSKTKNIFGKNQEKKLIFFG